MTDQQMLKKLPEDLQTVTQSGLVVMVYDEILAALEDAVEAIAAGEIERRFRDVTVATNLLCELRIALDGDQGGEIAGNLGAIYGYVLGFMHRINTENNATLARRAMSLLKPLRDSWFNLDRRIEAGAVPGIAPMLAFVADQAKTTAAAEHRAAV